VSSPASRQGSRAYRGLVLDFGGVLTTSFADALRSFCMREGLDPDALHRVFSRDRGARGALVDLERGAIGQAEFTEQLAGTLRVEPEGLLERMAADLRPEQAVLSAVDELRTRGVRVGVLSNSWGSRPFDPYASWRLVERFDVVVISDQVGMRKPEPAIFRLILDRLALPGEQCVFVDDVASYLPAGRALGMATVHATDPDATVAELHRLFSLR
jgi:putative hydrolase of the HAD superfamily